MGIVPTIGSELESGIMDLVQVATPTVDRMLDSFRNQWLKTAEDCLTRAAELEDAAHDLRLRADKLLEASQSLPDEVKGCVIFEIKARERAASLKLVNPPQDD